MGHNAARSTRLRAARPCAVVLAAAALAACAPAARPAETAVASNAQSSGGERPRAEPLEMHLTATDGARGRTAQIDVELRSDGEILWRGAPGGRLINDRIVAPDGSELVSGTAGSSVMMRRRRRRVEVLDSGALVLDESERLYFDPDGRVVQTRPRQSPRWMEIHITGLRPEGMRAAALMLLYGMVRSSTAAAATSSR